jgi:hypothetical protein
VLWIYAALWACVFAAVWVPTVMAVADHDVRLDSFGAVTSSGGQTGATLSAVEVLVVVAIVAIWLSFVSHQVLSWRRTTGERRQQQKWLASGAAITIAGFALGAVQQLVVRRFNRARYDAEHTVTVFAARLMDAVDLDTVRDDLAAVVSHALEPTHVSMWSRQAD